MKSQQKIIYKFDYILLANKHLKMGKYFTLKHTKCKKINSPLGPNAFQLATKRLYEKFQRSWLFFFEDMCVDEKKVKEKEKKVLGWVILVLGKCMKKR